MLLLDKPQGMSSNGALQTAKRLLEAAKAGHTGTLDPMATGLLPLTFGEATKFSQMLLDADKGYEATVQLGVETDTGDAEGKRIATAPVAVSREAIERALEAFRGEIEQVPPMYSALKVAGKPLYEYARDGIELERAPRRVTVHALELVDAEAERFRIRVRCSKGTYIRTLAIDLGRALGCGAHLSALRRTRIGPFEVASAVSLPSLEAAPIEARAGLLAPVDALVAHLPAVELDPLAARAILHGQGVAVPNAPEGLLRIYAQRRFLGLAESDGRGRVSPKRLVATPETVVQAG